MAKVIIYSADYCPYCRRAKALLDSKGISYKEINLDNDPETKRKIMEQTGMRTIPQIFINGELVGGYSELYQLDQSGKLDQMLK
ncbi:MAG: glutaredoxin 3 [Bdellovibrio sp.]|nr:MAG: glutaredoxin 3 [Bdellovibrio sp.]